MTSAERMDNLYFDKNGIQILEGDLLKVFHFRKGRRTYYMYHIVVMEQLDFPEMTVMSAKDYWADKPHYRLYVLCNNPQRLYFDAEIIYKKNWKSNRKKIKIDTLITNKK